MTETNKPERCPTPRQRIYDWMDKSYHEVRARVVELGLFEEGDDQVSGDKIYLLWIQRAKAKNLVDALLNDGHTQQAAKKPTVWLHPPNVVQGPIPEHLPDLWHTQPVAPAAPELNRDYLDLIPPIPLPQSAYLNEPVGAGVEQEAPTAPVNFMDWILGKPHWQKFRLEMDALAREGQSASSWARGIQYWAEAFAAERVSALQKELLNERSDHVATDMDLSAAKDKLWKAERKVEQLQAKLDYCAKHHVEAGD